MFNIRLRSKKVQDMTQRSMFSLSHVLTPSALLQPNFVRNLTNKLRSLCISITVMNLGWSMY